MNASIKKMAFVFVMVFCAHLSNAQYYGSGSSGGGRVENPKQNVTNLNGIETGYRGFIDLGYTIGTGDYSDDRVELSTSHGFQFNPYFFAGIGAGAQYYFDCEEIGVPVFAHLRSDFLSSNITPFIEAKIGYSVTGLSGLYFAPSIGCRFSGGFSISLGYVMQKTEIDVYYSEYYYDYYWDYGYYNYYEDTESVTFGGFNFKLGFEF